MTEERNNYVVSITKDALQDIDDIYKYIACVLKAPETAKNLCAKIRKAILSLSYYPKKYATFYAESKTLKEYRKISLNNYLIIYIIVENKVIVTNVFYGASDVITKLSNK